MANHSMMGDSLTEDPMLLVQWSPWPFLPWFCSHGDDDANGEVSCLASNPTIPKSMCNGFWNVGITHETFITNVLKEPNSPHVNCHGFVPY